jgi:uncharacterized protein
VSERLPTREEALHFLRQAGCRENVIRHAEAVAELAMEIARACKEKKMNINLNLVETGALLHDIGRSKTHSVHHAVVGAEIAKTLNLPKPVISIIKRHVGGGISVREAKKLGWPRDLYIPQSLEEKIVAYADKLIEGTRRVPIEKTIESLSREVPSSAIARMQKLNDEMLGLIGDCKCLP